MGLPGKGSRIALLILIAALVAAFFASGLHHHLTLANLKARQQEWVVFYGAHPGLTITAYAFVYVVVTALSLPGATVLSLAGGALFGVMTGTVVISFASTVGATLAFLVARYILHDAVQKRFGDKLVAINRGMAAEGAFYLFAMRLVPVFPFFVINLLMGLTPLSVGRFYIVSQLGMLPGTVAYVYAGTQLGQIDSLGGIMSPGVLTAFAVLGTLPLIAKKVLALVRRRHAQSDGSRRGDGT